MAADLATIRRAFCSGDYAFTATGYAKMSKRGLRAEELEEAICRDSPELIEEYPADSRGPACLILGWADLVRPLHIEIGYDPAMTRLLTS